MKNLDPKTYAKWLVVFSALSVGALSGLSWTFSNPDNHPLIFALSLSWVIAVVTSAVTRNFSLGLNPRRFGFASWEREGEIYGRSGLNAFLWLLKHTPLGWLNPWLRLAPCRSGLEPLLREMFYAEGAHWIGGGDDTRLRRRLRFLGTCRRRAFAGGGNHSISRLSRNAAAS